MTKANFKKIEGLWTSLEVSGHANFASAGNDIVCAGISTAVILSINLLKQFINGRFKVVENQKLGLIAINEIDYESLSDNEISIVDKIFTTLYDCLNDIANDYPNNFKIKIENK